MTQDALYHVHVHVLFAQQRPGGVPRVVQSCGLGNARLGEQGFPLVPVVMRVDRAAVWPAPDQIPLLPLPRSFPLGVLGLQVHTQRWDELYRDRHGPLALALRPGEFPPAFPLRARLGVARAIRGTELRALPAVRGAAARTRLSAYVLAAGYPLGLRAARRARVNVLALAARVRVGAPVAESLTLDLPVHEDDAFVKIDVRAA